VIDGRASLRQSGRENIQPPPHGVSFAAWQILPMKFNAPRTVSLLLFAALLMGVLWLVPERVDTPSAATGHPAAPARAPADPAVPAGGDSAPTATPSVASAEADGELIERGPAAGRRLRVVPPQEVARRLDPDQTRLWEQFQQQHPGVDPSDLDTFSAALLRERQRYSLQLTAEERITYGAWLAATESLSQAMIEARGTLLGIPLHGVDARGREFGLIGFDGARPLYNFAENREAAVSTAASFVRRNSFFDPVVGPDIDGGGFFAIVQDTGTVDLSPEFRNDADTAWRLTIVRGTSPGEHGTHVAGIIAARGLDARAMGMAPAVHVYSMSQVQTSDILGYGMDWPGSPDRAIAGNCSLGTEDPVLTGVYNSTTAAYDQVLYDSPYYMHFYSAGNSGPDFLTITRSRKEGKNLFAVGNLDDVFRNSQGVRTGGGGLRTSSSRGPVRDGRIKPDVVANGGGVYSPHNTTSYSIRSGTSMASPNAAGSTILVQDAFNRLLPGHLMRAATLKALIINTAEDLGLPGPDYMFGWGLVNVLEASRVVQRYAQNPAGRALVEGRIDNGQTVEIPYAYDGSGPVRVTLAWTDLPGPARSTSTATLSSLINNLNLRLIGPTGTVHLPFVMPYVTGADGHAPFSPELYFHSATTGINSTDNKTQVFIVNPVPGTYRVEVTHAGNLVGGSQQYSLAVHGMTSTLPPAPPVITSHPSADPAKARTFLFTVNGSGFLLGADVIFRRTGYAPVKAFGVEVVGDRIRARIPVDSMEPNPWQVVVRNPDGLESVSPTPFLAEYLFIPFNWTGGSTGNGTVLFSSAVYASWSPTLTASDIGPGAVETFRIATRTAGGPGSPIGAGGNLSLSGSPTVGALLFDDTHGHFPAELIIAANQGLTTARLLTFAVPDSTIITLTDAVRSRVKLGHDRLNLGNLALRLPASGVNTIHVAHADATLDLTGLYDETSISGIGWAGIHAGSTIASEDRARLRKTGAGTLDLRIDDPQGNRTKGLIIEGGTVLTAKNADLGWAPTEVMADHVVINGGTLHLQGFTANSGETRGFQLGNHGGTIQLTGQNHALLGIVADVPGEIGTLFKTGDSALRLANSNTYSGGTQILEGRIRYTVAGSLGGGSVTLGNDTSLTAWAPDIALPNTIEIAGDTTRLGGDGYALQLHGTIDLMEGDRTLLLGDPVFVHGGLTNGGLARVVADLNGTDLTILGAATVTGSTTIERGGLIVNGSYPAAVHATRGVADAAAIGRVGGTGVIAGSVTVDGELHPGADAVTATVGTLQVGGDLVLGEHSVAHFELATASTADQVAVAGTVTATGTIRVVLLGGYEPAIGTSFRVIAAPQPLSLGAGLGFDLADPGTGKRWDTSAFASTGTLAVVDATVPDPYETWASSFGLSGADAQPFADPDGDGLPNRLEFLLGFDPTDPQSTLTAILVSDGGVLRLEINRVVTEGSFAIESAESAGGPWQQIMALSIGTPVSNYRVTLPDAPPPRFYRVRYTAP